VADDGDWSDSDYYGDDLPFWLQWVIEKKPTVRGIAGATLDLLYTLLPQVFPGVHAPAWTTDMPNAEDGSRYALGGIAAITGLASQFANLFSGVDKR
jgi:hypothetical protein